MSKTVQDLYKEQLALSHRINAQNELYWLLEKALGIPRAVFFKTDMTSLGERHSIVSNYLEQYHLGKPLAYILGDTPFLDIDILTEEGVLIPRADTEPMVKELCSMIHPDMRVCDLGCGTGAIAVSIAKACGVSVLAIDKSEHAIHLTQKNINQQKLAHLVTTYLGSWYDQPSMGLFDIVVSNPPYIAKGDDRVWESVDKFEPHDALYAEDAGLSDIKAIIQYACKILKPEGKLAIEHGKDQQPEVINALQEAGYEPVHIRNVFGIPRYVIARRHGN